MKLSLTFTTAVPAATFSFRLTLASTMFGASFTATTLIVLTAVLLLPPPSLTVILITRAVVFGVSLVLAKLIALIAVW